MTTSASDGGCTSDSLREGDTGASFRAVVSSVGSDVAVMLVVKVGSETGKTITLSVANVGPASPHAVHGNRRRRRTRRPRHSQAPHLANSLTRAEYVVQSCV